MEVAVSLIGIVVFLVLKKTVFQVDKGKALISSVLELPVDVNLVGFMLCMTTLATLDEPNELAPHTVLCSVLVMNISVLLWKYSCTLITESGVGVQFPRPILISFISLINFALAVAAIALPTVFLGASM
ncbi:hypothetical protein [Ruegeria arenilitoris]|uniref:hypothetical protein n=1 Tax=Ruegeria arenilitoris TaxID=1173585 RepID=UPI003C7B362A